MKMSDDVATKVADLLLRIKAVELSPEKPFRWSSGALSPIYCDNRKILSYPSIRTQIRERMCERIRELFGEPEAVIGVATGGISMGTLVAQEMQLPFAYVRGKPKSHGKENAIEGALEEGQEAVLIEDLISTGKSSLNAVQRLRDGGYRVKGLAAIFTYGFQEAEERFEEANCPATALTDHQTLVQEASSRGSISEKELEILEEWRASPEAWHHKNAYE